MDEKPPTTTFDTVPVSSDALTNPDLSPSATSAENYALQTTEPRGGRLSRSLVWVGRKLDQLHLQLDSGARFVARAWVDSDNPIPRMLMNKRSFTLGWQLTLVAFLAYGFLDCFYVVDVGQEGAHLRLGRFSHVTQPGLNFKLPYGIDEVIFVNTQFVIQEEFGYRTKIHQGPIVLLSEPSLPPPEQGDHEVVELTAEHTEVLNAAEAPVLVGHPEFLKAESKMLTGNLNILDVSWAVQYEVVDSYHYLFQSAEPARNLRDLAAAAMSKAVGNRLDMEILTLNREALEQDAKRITQQLLDTLNIGLRVKDILIQDVSPPGVTQAAYHEVNSAAQDVEHLINQAERTYNQTILRAYGEADEIKANAEAYKLLVVNRAHGEASRFKQIVDEYKLAPEVTRTRIFLETMEDVFSKVPYTLIDDDIKGVVPFFGAQGAGHAPLPASIAPAGQVVTAEHLPGTFTNTFGLPMAQLASVAPIDPVPLEPGVSGAPAAVQAPHVPIPANQSAQQAQIQAQHAKTGWSFFGWW